MSVSDQPVLYNQHCCPYGQRVWMALLHKGIDFTYIEQNPYHKTPEWLSVNPRGLVPALIHRGRSIIESAIIMEYLDEEWRNNIRLVPRDPYRRSTMRLLVDIIVRSIIAPYNIVLKSPIRSERAKATVKLLEGILQLFNLADPNGPFLLGQECSFADIMLAPHMQRICLVLPQYRGLRIPSCAKFRRFRIWWGAVEQLESFKQSSQTRETLLMNYKKYSETV